LCLLWLLLVVPRRIHLSVVVVDKLWHQIYGDYTPNPHCNLSVEIWYLHATFFYSYGRIPKEYDITPEYQLSTSHTSWLSSSHQLFNKHNLLIVIDLQSVKISVKYWWFCIYRRRWYTTTYLLPIERVLKTDICFICIQCILWAIKLFGCGTT